MKKYLIIYEQPKIGLRVQVRNTYEEAQAVVETNGGYIVETVESPKDTP